MCVYGISYMYSCAHYYVSDDLYDFCSDTTGCLYFDSHVGFKCFCSWFLFFSTHKVVFIMVGTSSSDADIACRRHRCAVSPLADANLQCLIEIPVTANCVTLYFVKPWCHGGTTSMYLTILHMTNCFRSVMVTPILTSMTVKRKHEIFFVRRSCIAQVCYGTYRYRYGHMILELIQQR